MPTEPATVKLTLDLTRLPPPSTFWPARVMPDVLPFQEATFEHAVIGMAVLNVSRLRRFFDELGRVVVAGGELEFVVRDDDPVDGLSIRLPDLVAAVLRSFDVQSVGSADGRVVVTARNRPARRPADPAARGNAEAPARHPAETAVETVDPAADAAAALICVMRERDLGRAVGNGTPVTGRPWRVDLASSTGTPAETVRFESAKLPTGPSRRPDLRVAAVLGDRSRAALGYEFALEPVGPDSWTAAFRPAPPHLLLVESSYRGPAAGAAFTADGGLNRWVRDLLDRCRRHGVPTVFWNNDDPLDYGSFLDGARQFDWVFTVDADCVPRYRSDLGHDRVGVLPFAIQPRIHNPIGALSHYVGDLAYPASCSGRDRPAHTARLGMLLGGAADLGLHILALDGAGSRPVIPSGLDHTVVGHLAYDQLLSAYRRYRVFLSVNPAPESPTRLPPELLESLACGTPVVSAPSSAIAPMLGAGLVEVGSDTSTARMLVNALLASTELRDRRAVEGVRRVMRDHSYPDRIDDLLRAVGLGAPASSRPLVSIVAPTHRPDGYQSIIRNAARQTYPDVELILGLHGVDVPESRIRDAAREHGLRDLTMVRLPSERSLGSVCNELIAAASGSHVARMDDDDFYGPHYLEDQLRAFEYTDADLVGKWTRFIYLEKLPALGVIFPGSEHVYGAPLCGGTLLMRRELCDVVKFADRTRGEDIGFVIDCARQGFATYATDRFNYVYVRHTDTSRHTYQPDDLELLSRTRIVSFGSSLEHAYV